MGAYRYWRLSLDRANPNSRVGLRGMELRGVVGGPTLTVPGGAISASPPPVLPASNLIDGNPSTQYESAGSPTVTYDFGVPTEVVEVAFQLNGYGGYMSPAPGSYVSASNDLASWVYFGPPFGWSSSELADVWVSVRLTVESDFSANRAAAGAPVRLPTAWPTDVPRGRMAAPAPILAGLDIGPYRIAGNVFIDGTPDVPVSRRVRLFDRRSARLIREVWSDAGTGAYSFENLPLQPDGYFVLSHDHTGVFNAEVKDRIQPIL